MKSIFTSLLIASCLLKGICLHAQETNLPGANMATETTDALNTAHAYILSHLVEWGLTTEDVLEMTVNDMYTDKGSEITRIYFLQRYQGIPVHNAILNVSINKEGLVFFAGNRFIPHIKDKINTTVPKLKASEAVIEFAASIRTSARDLQLKEAKGKSEFIFAKGDIAKEDITASLVFQPDRGKLFLSWDLVFSPVGFNDKWSVRIDAVTGAVLNKNNWTVYCFENGASFAQGNNCEEYEETNDAEVLADEQAASYKVWPAPMLGAHEGPRKLVTDPADDIASPYGWHDFDGQPGAEFTVTCGNNAWVFQDRDNIGDSSNDEPDGGSELYFDFPYNPNLEPKQNIDASVVNLFYWINYMHDFSYRFGFDESAGNFQQNNYGRGGLGIDKMIGVTQAAENLNLIDNPYYQHGNEGKIGALYIPEFARRARSLTVNEPADLSGDYETGTVGDGWGPGSQITHVPVEGEVVLAFDGFEENSFTDGCEEIVNASELAGKIAFIDRGNCEFSLKALHAQEAGAIGIIICNYNDDSQFLLAPGAYGSGVNIPVVIIPASDGQLMRPYIGHGLKVSFVRSALDGPQTFDVGLDNSLIAHEYGHGISFRLCGGPNATCLYNDEQMNEGWSDFFGLVTTVRPGDTGDMPRGIGTYIADDLTTGRGIRRYPYSTDMNIDPLTYGHVAISQIKIHSIGEVWCSVLWDMYWAFVDEYGWSADLYDESTGNYKATRLVFDGLKNLPCSPGFVDARNAILAADESLFGGENNCLLWRVFARRGLGFSADQGSPFDAGDQTEAFDLPPDCTNKINIEKSVTDFIQAGEEIQVTIKVTNNKKITATNVVVSDVIPEGTTFKDNSSNYTYMEHGSSILWDLGNMISGKEKTITYTLQTSANESSLRKFIDEVSVESGSNWLSSTIGNGTPNDWFITDLYPGHTGNFSWNVKEIPAVGRSTLVLNPNAYAFHVDGTHPVMRFYHRYQTQQGLDGGVVDVREVGTSQWTPVNEEIIRHAYNSYIMSLTFGLNDALAFSGNSGNDYKASYVDLSQWKGKDIQVRFRFGTYTNNNDGVGWLIDDIEFMDLLSYNSEVCVSSDQGDQECTIAPEAGTIVETKETTTSTAKPLETLQASIYPNPAKDIITVQLFMERDALVDVRLLSVDGKIVLNHSFPASSNVLLNINTGKIPDGLYFVHLMTEDDHFVKKVVIQK